MKQHSKRLVLALLGMAAVLVACGGGGGDGGTVPAPGTTTSEVPSSALQDSGGLVAYLKDLIANRSNNTGEPVVLGNVTLPTSEVAEPVPLN